MLSKILSTAIFLTLLTAVTAIAGEKPWRIFDVRGKATMISPDGSRMVLSNEKNLLEPLDKGSKVKVEGQGKVVIVSLRNRQAFEVGDNSEALVEEDQVVAVKGKVTAKKGYALPTGKDGRMGGIVMRGTGNPRSCLKAVSPVNTAILDVTPILSWANSCDGLKQVTITVLADDRILATAESSDTTYRVPVGLVKPGNRYMWLIDGGANFDMASGVFTVLAEPELSEVRAKLTAVAADGGGDIASMIALIYYLEDKGLKDLARQESDKLRKLYPGAAGLKDLP